MTQPVDLAKVKWLQLCDQADKAATQRPPNRASDDLPITAGRLTTVKPLPYSAPDEALLNSFRWDCTAFGLALPITRRLLAPGLLAKSALVRALLTPRPDEGEDRLPLPEPGLETVTQHAWMGRADLAG